MKYVSASCASCWTTDAAGVDGHGFQDGPWWSAATPIQSLESLSLRGVPEPRMPELTLAAKDATQYLCGIVQVPGVHLFLCSSQHANGKCRKRGELN